MKTRIYVGDRLAGKFTCDGRKMTKFQAFRFKVAQYTKRTMVVMAGLSVIGWSVYAGSNYVPRTVYAEKEVVVTVKGHSPVMDRIAQCESGGSHYDKKTGQVIMRANTNKTVDVGKYQINSVWYKKATELGLDITKEKDNEAMAYWIYENRGTGDWIYSSNCWSK